MGYFSSPEPPDPYETAQAQSGANMQAAQASSIIGNPNETNPYGTVNYTKSGNEWITDASGKRIKVPRYERTVALSPEQQRLYNLQTRTQTNLGQLGVSQSKRLQGLLGTNLDTKGLNNWKDYSRAPELATSFADAGNIRQDTGPTNRQGVEDAMLGRYRQQSAQARSAQDAQLAARGMAPGSQQWGSVEDTRNRADVDAYQQAYLASGDEARAAQAAFNQAQQQRFGQNVNTAEFANKYGQQNWANENQFVDAMNALRGQQLQERQTLRNAPINEITALMSGSQVTVPQFQAYNSPSVAAANIGQYIQDNYNTQSQQSQAAMSGMFGMGSSFMEALPSLLPMLGFGSDRRMKRDIVPLDAKLAGLPLYSFTYRDGLGQPEGPQVGVMSDEVREVYPEAVTTGIDGYDRVDYGHLFQKERYHASTHTSAAA
jgi:hypothetical protein